MLIFQRLVLVIGLPKCDDHSNDDADCGGNQRYVQKVQSVSVLGNVDVQEDGADVKAYRDTSFLWWGVYIKRPPRNESRWSKLNRLW